MATLRHRRFWAGVCSSLAWAAASAQISRVDFADANGSALSVGVTINSFAQHDCILVLVGVVDPNMVSSVTATSESNLTLGIAHTGGPSGEVLQWAYLSDVTTAGNKTITANLADTGTNYISAWRLSGCDNTGMLDDDQGASSTGTDPTIAVTTSQATDALFGAIHINNSAATAGSTFTAETVIAWSFWQNTEYRLDAGAAGSKNVAFMDATSGDYVIAAIALKAAGGGGGGGGATQINTLQGLGKAYGPQKSQQLGGLLN